MVMQKLILLLNKVCTMISTWPSCDNRLSHNFIKYTCHVIITWPILLFPGGIMYQYFVKVVPTLYQHLNGELMTTNQFAVTKHTKTVKASTGEQGLPGNSWSLYSHVCTRQSISIHVCTVHMYWMYDCMYMHCSVLQ